MCLQLPCILCLGDSCGSNQSYQLNTPAIDVPDHSCVTFADELHTQQSIFRGTQLSSHADQEGVGSSGRRPSLLQITLIQKQHTIAEDDDYDEKMMLPSAPNLEPSTKSGQEVEYQDTKNLFRGLQQDYAWMKGINKQTLSEQ